LALSLAINGLDAGYGAVKALRGVSLDVRGGETVALLGTNGNGKSTLMKCIAGLVRPQRGSISLDIDGTTHDLAKLSAEDIVDLGVAMVPEGRRLFPSLSVEENLLVGGQLGRKGPWNLKRVYELFPMLEEHRKKPAPSLSGGQQQMVAIGRALMAKPQVLLLDEPTEGLAPIYVRLLFELLRTLRDRGQTILIVEQNVHHVLRTADRAYVLENGRIVMSGSGEALLHDQRVRQAYLG